MHASCNYRPLRKWCVVTVATTKITKPYPHENRTILWEREISVKPYKLGERIAHLSSLDKRRVAKQADKIEEELLGTLQLLLAKAVCH